MAENSREIDLDIVSTSWRSMTDQDAFEQLLEAWERKLAFAKRQPRIPLLDNVLRNQLGPIDQLLNERRDLQIGDPLELVLSETPAPAMVLSPQGLVAAHNYGAASYFGVEQGLHAGTTWLREDSLADYTAVHGAGIGKSNIDYAIVRINREHDQAVFAEVYRLDIEGTDGTYTVVRSLELDWDPSISLALMKAFGMTQAESEICELLYVHRDLSTIAERRSVALGTVRMQVKSILNKAEIRSKTELVRFFAQLCARAASKRAKTKLTWADPLGHEKFFKRRDGRKLAYTWLGAEDGRPILYMPDHTSCSLFPELVRSRLAECGVKLIIISLPGYGNSDPSPDKDQLRDSCDAIVEWSEAMQMGPLPAIAGRGAQFILIHLAKLRPDLCQFIMCVGLPWNITSKRTAGMGAADITLLKLSHDAPFAYDVACRIGYRLIKKHGPDFYWKNIFSGNEADLETSKNVEALPLLRATVQHLFAQGYQAFKRSQEICARYSISERVKDLQTPVHWVVPELTVDLEEDDLDEIPLSTLEIVPDTGELLPFQQPELFAERLIALAGPQSELVFASRFGKTNRW